MAAPGTYVNWHDLSEINNNVVADVVDDSPLFCQVFSADKGTEELTIISGSDNFDAMYGNMSFARHGQSAIQAKAIIDAGGRLFCKRIVAEDSTLANLVVTATVTGSDGSATIKYETQSVSGCKSYKEVEERASALLDDNAGVYPLMFFTDNGRGVSSKSVRITPDYQTSKTIGKTFYTLVIYEGNDVIERNAISLDPTVIYQANAYRLDESVGVQVKGLVDDAVYELFVHKIATALNKSADEIRNNDLLYGYTYKGSEHAGLSIDSTSVDLDATTGVALAEGTNGEFGDAPVDTAAWEAQLNKVFTGEFDNRIFDVDQYKFAAIVDADYPRSTKKAIFDLVEFRQDFVYFRDYGTKDLNSFLEIKAAHDGFIDERSRFVADYFTTYQIKEPTTRKNITVTMLYDLAIDLVDHVAGGAFNPVAGSINGFILPNAIEGTINFTPINTPSINQKEAVDELRVNYAIFEGRDCVVQSSYTSQDRYTQLSYVNNVLAIQTVMRDVRNTCPKQRYALSTTGDLQAYADAVNEVLSDYTTNFDLLEFEYTSDPLKESQKIFYASIRFAFLNWAQTEVFDIYAVNND